MTSVKPPKFSDSKGAVFRRHNSHSSPALGPDIDEQLWSVVSGQVTEDVVRTRILQMAQKIIGATAACFLVRSSLQTWLPSTSSPRLGRLPGEDVFSDDFSQQCDGFAKSPNIQTTQLGNRTALLAPLRTSTTGTEIMLIVVGDKRQAAEATRVLQKMSGALQLWMRGRLAQDHEWQVGSLGTIVELIGRLEKRHTIEEAGEELVNLLGNHLPCRAVALGLTTGRRIRLSNISGVAKPDKGSDTSKSYVAALTESLLRKQPGIFPAIDPENNQLLQAHRQLAGQLQCESVVSFPLITDDDQQIGSVVIAGTAAQLGTTQLSRFCAAAASPIARTLQTVNRVRLSRFRRATRFVKEKLASLKAAFVLLGVALVVVAMFVPITYRVRCNCVTEVTTKRFAVAPFDGLIITGSAKAGDLVEEGEMLCEMDGRTIRWELSGVSAERQQSARTREIELTGRNIPKAFLAELEHDRLTAEEAILQYKRDHLQVRSPINGVVLSGEVERAEAASVKTGDVLFEIGPLKPMRVQIAVPAEEIAQVKAGHPVKIWINGQEDETIEGTIECIKPRSETRDARNVFVAEVEFPNDDERLRPGMSGTVRIDCEERSLGWSLFHKPMNYMRSRFVWW